MTEFTPIEKAAAALAQLSDAAWLELKCAEDRRRSERDLSRELRDRKMEPARTKDALR